MKKEKKKKGHRKAVEKKKKKPKEKRCLDLTLDLKTFRSCVVRMNSGSKEFKRLAEWGRKLLT